jgi:hypothetical protein
MHTKQAIIELGVVQLTLETLNVLFQNVKHAQDSPRKKTKVSSKQV